jgi:hypothetical protein
MRRLRSICVVVAGAMTAVVGLSTTAQSAPSSGNVSHAISAAQANAALQYWTAARMATARVADAAAPTTLPPPARIAPPATGPAVTVPPVAGQLGADPIQPLASGVARPYRNLPDRLNGKVFFTDVNGSTFVCSGTVVNSQNQDLVDTAGHCVSNGSGSFHSNWIFVPGYSSQCSGCADAPFGVWSARSLATRTDWHVSADLKVDLGYGVLNMLSGSHIVASLGGQGSAFNQSRTQAWRDYGYPQAAPFNGYDQFLCRSGRLADDDPAPGQAGPLTIRIRCNMTGGSSGGGWLIQVSRGLGFVNSHNSYRYVGGPLTNPGHMYGPFFGDEALALFQFAQSM